MSHWVTAMTDFDGVASLDPAKNRRLFKLVDKLGAVVKAATVARPGEIVATGVPCGGRVGRVPCPGYLDLHRQQVPEQIEWSCLECRDSGVIHDFRGTIWDLTPKGALTDWDGEWRQVMVSPNEYDAIRAMAIADPDGERTIYRAERRGGLIVLAANEDELNHLSGLVADEAGHELNRRRRLDLNAVFDRISEAVGPPF